MNLKNLISHVKRNCNISDAKFWGFYSMKKDETGISEYIEQELLDRKKA